MDKRTFPWAANAAFVWSVLFALMSFYWASGGLVGVETLGAGMKALALARDPALTSMTWLTGLLKLAAAVVALGLAHFFSRWLPRRWLLLGGWVVGGLFVVYGVANGIQHTLMLTDASPIPSLLGTPQAVRWQLLFWDPFWLIGGILFLTATYQYQKARTENRLTRTR